MIQNEELEDITQTEQITMALDWLDQNRCPTSDLQDKLQQYWALTVHKRKPSKELMNNWSHYKLPTGYLLIHIDFEFNFKSAKKFNNMIFENFVETDFNILKMEIKSAVYKKVIDNYLVLNDGMYMLYYEDSILTKFFIKIIRIYIT